MKHINAKYIAKAKIALILFACVLSTGCSGCSETESENVTTNGIYADIEVIGNSNDTTDVIVDLNVGSGLGGTDLELSDGDRLTASTNGQTHTLSKSENLVNIEYITTFDANAADMAFTVSFTRENGINAEDSRVTLPAPFTLITPTDGETFAIDDPVIFEWSPADENSRMEISSVYTCRQHTDTEGTATTIGTGVGGRIADNGSATYTMRQLMGTSNPENYNLGCTIDIELSRNKAGTIDSNFGEGGQIIAKQSRSLEIRYNPNGAATP